MVRGPLQQARRSSHFPSGLRWQGLFTGFPDRHRALHADNILQLEFGKSVAKLGVDAVSRVSQNNATVQFGRNRRTDLIQRNVRLGLKLNLLGHFRLFPPLGILGPFLRQI